jgi:hypothetical protein
MSEPAVQPSPSRTHSRTRLHFVRDVVVFQVKLLVDNLRDLALTVLSLAAAVLDLASREDQQGRRFYAVLRWGRKCQQMTNLYSVIEDE